MPKSVLRAVLGRIQFTLHATCRTPHGASRLVQAMSAWLVKTRRGPSRRSRDARGYGHTNTAMPKLSTPLPSPSAPHPPLISLMLIFRRSDLTSYTCSVPHQFSNPPEDQGFLLVNALLVFVPVGNWAETLSPDAFGGSVAEYQISRYRDFDRCCCIFLFSPGASRRPGPGGCEVERSLTDFCPR